MKETHGFGRRGQSLIAIVIMMGALIALAGTSLLLFSNSLIGESYGYKASVGARAVSESGIEDALVRINRNPGISTESYNVTVGQQTAAVTITQGSPSSGEDTIVSSATVSGDTIDTTVVVAINPSTGVVAVVSRQSTAP